MLASTRMQPRCARTGISGAPSEAGAACTAVRWGIIMPSRVIVHKSRACAHCSNQGQRTVRGKPGLHVQGAARKHQPHTMAPIPRRGIRTHPLSQGPHTERWETQACGGQHALLPLVRGSRSRLSANRAASPAAPGPVAARLQAAGALRARSGAEAGGGPLYGRLVRGPFMGAPQVRHGSG